MHRTIFSDQKKKSRSEFCERTENLIKKKKKSQNRPKRQIHLKKKKNQQNPDSKIKQK